MFKPFYQCKWERIKNQFGGRGKLERRAGKKKDEERATKKKIEWVPESKDRHKGIRENEQATRTRKRIAKVIKLDI